MITKLRQIVAGPKNRTVYQNYDLDFTYITETVVAMAYPASGLEQTYRNSITDVAKYLQERHSQGYLIVNVSNRKYGYKIFNNMVKEYPWEDHQAPTLDILFQIANDSYEFLTGSNHIVCFHCNHGKGRTGTSIICLFIYAGFYKNVEEALKFYNKKRFNGKNYGVSQPCQIRYMEYFLQCFNQIKSQIYQPRIKAYRLSKIVFEGLQPNQYQIVIYSTKDQKVLHKKIELVEYPFESYNNRPLFSDLYIEITKKGWIGQKIVARANINLNFLEKHNTQLYVWKMMGPKVRVSSSHHINFMVEFYFEEYCQCHVSQSEECQCKNQREIQQKSWEKIIKLAKLGARFDSRQTCKMLFPSLVGMEQETNNSLKQQIMQNKENNSNN